MSWKIIAGLLIVIVIEYFTVHHFAFDAGSTSRDLQCATDRAADQKTYEAAQTSAVSKAASAQAQADAQQLADVRAQLQTAQQQATLAQKKADAAKATADNLNANLARLKNESKDVNVWSNACLPAELLGSLHSQSSGQTATGHCK